VYISQTLAPNAAARATAVVSDPPLPNVVTVLGWHSCDHTGPVHEGDTLTSELHVENSSPLEHGTAVQLRSLVFSHNASATQTPVLDWRFTVLMA